MNLIFHFISGGIDGMFVRMSNIQGFPPGYNRELFFNRKGFTALNCLVFAGFDHTIYDLVPNSPGSFHDSSIYRVSGMKAYLETRFPRVQVLGTYLDF